MHWTTDFTELEMIELAEPRYYEARINKEVELSGWPPISSTPTFVSASACLISLLDRLRLMLVTIVPLLGL